ncbi:MAG: response regulator transcription factor [Bacteroidota bacterium]
MHIRYAIADDHKIFRQGLKLVLDDDSSLLLAGEAENGKELMEILQSTKVDIVLLDLKMPDMDGFEATQEIRKCYPDVKIIILTMHSEESFIIHLLELGANGYLIKNTGASEILKAIHTVYETNYYFNEMVSKTLLKKIAVNDHYKPRNVHKIELTEREKQVLVLICEEKNAAEIGAVMFLSPRTIEGIRGTLLEKIKVRNIAGLVLYAVKNGLVQ